MKGTSVHSTRCACTKRRKTPLIVLLNQTRPRRAVPLQLIRLEGFEPITRVELNERRAALEKILITDVFPDVRIKFRTLNRIHIKPYTGESPVRIQVCLNYTHHRVKGGTQRIMEMIRTRLLDLHADIVAAIGNEGLFAANVHVYTAVDDPTLALNTLAFSAPW